MLTCRSRALCRLRHAMDFFSAVRALRDKRRIRSFLFYDPFLDDSSKHAIEHTRSSLRNAKRLI